MRSYNADLKPMSLFASLTKENREFLRDRRQFDMLMDRIQICSYIITPTGANLLLGTLNAVTLKEPIERTIVTAFIDGDSNLQANYDVL